MKTKILSLIFLTCTYFSQAQSWVETQKVVAPDREQNGRFGEYVAIYEDFAIVGTPWHSENNINLAGSAYIYQRNSVNGWDLMQLILPQNIQTGDNFGISVDIYGDYAAISSRQFINGNGAVYIYKRNELGVWNEIQYIEAPEDIDVIDKFGYKVSLSNSGLAVTLISEINKIYIFERDNNDIYNQVQLIQGSDTELNDNFGWAISLKENTLIVGAQNESGATSSERRVGAVYVFTKQPDGNWNEVQKITAMDRIEFSEFGNSLSINDQEDKLIIGSPMATIDTNILNQGVVYVFNKNASDLWTEEQIITASDADMFKRFGSSVAIEDNMFIVGAAEEDHEIVPGQNVFGTGAVYMFSLEQNNSWIEVEKLTPSDYNDNAQLGYSLDLSGDTFITGARYEIRDENDSNPILNAGAVYFFQDANTLSVKNYLKTENFISVYPNPTTGYINFKFEYTVKEGKIILRNVLGQQIQSKNFYNTKDFGLDINNSSGLYILEVYINNTNREVFRIIKT